MKWLYECEDHEEWKALIFKKELGNKNKEEIQDEYPHGWCQAA